MLSLFIAIACICIRTSAIKDLSGSYCAVPASEPGSCLGSDISLLGRHIQLGVHRVASYGSNTAPSGSISHGNPLGCLSDFDENGFDKSSYCDEIEGWYYYGDGLVCPNYSGDFITPGNPIEGKYLNH